MQRKVVSRHDIQFEAFAHVALDDPPLTYTQLVNALIDIHRKRDLVKSVLNEMIASGLLQTVTWLGDTRRHSYALSDEGTVRFKNLIEFEIEFSKKLDLDIKKMIGSLYEVADEQIQIVTRVLDNGLKQYAIIMTKKPEGKVAELLKKIEVTTEIYRYTAERLMTVVKHAKVRYQESRKEDKFGDLESDISEIDSFFEGLRKNPARQEFEI